MEITFDAQLLLLVQLINNCSDEAEKEVLQEILFNIQALKDADVEVQHILDMIEAGEDFGFMERPKQFS